VAYGILVSHIITNLALVKAGKCDHDTIVYRVLIRGLPLDALFMRILSFECSDLAKMFNDPEMFAG
jgi:hypothetical protein